MSPQNLLLIMLAFLLFSYLLEQLLDYLNLRHSLPELPAGLEDVYDEEAYRKSQLYKRDNTRFSFVSNTLSTALIMALFAFGFFAWLDGVVSGWTSNYILHVLLFFAVLAIAADLLGTPFSIYGTFVIEERYGFNRTTPRTFVLDKLKGWVLGAVIGGGLLALITWIYQMTGTWFWLLVLGVMTLFMVFMNLYYSSLIVPLFNKQEALEEGSLRSKIEAYAASVDFRLDNVFVMDGSKRSSKGNAYFTGLGQKKRVVLFDTLIDELDEEEIVAVLAHEIGHYKKKHTLSGLFTGILQTAFTLWLFSLFVGMDEISMALGAEKASFHLGLIAFGVLYSPISLLLGIAGNVISRRHEYQADRFAADTSDAARLISGLKKLSNSSLSNLTPHPAYVFMHYSHPTLLQRIRKLGYPGD